MSEQGNGRAPGDARDEVLSLAEEIELYLKRHPTASDTAVGIASWWLPGRRLAVTVTQVQVALKYLEDGGRIARVDRTGGDATYALVAHDMGPQE